MRGYGGRSSHVWDKDLRSTCVDVLQNGVVWAWRLPCVRWCVCRVPSARLKPLKVLSSGEAARE